MLEKLREKCKSLIEEDKDKYSLILKILSDDDCFRKIPMDTAYSILDDLKVDNKNKVYIELLKR